MKKLKKLKRPKAPKLTKNAYHGVRRLTTRRTVTPEEKVSDALSNVPRITNETVGEHREEVLSSARKYIYPLQHSKHRVVRTSIGLLVLVIVAFFLFCGLDLYKFQGTSGFIYDVTTVVPFPVAKAGPHWISYESYLFELRRNMHYYQTQQQSNFSTKSGKAQLARLKSQAMAQTVQDAYVKDLAAQYHVGVSNQAVDNQVALVRSQNRLGSSARTFREVLDEFWGWNEADFKRELKQQLLTQAVVAKLDTATAQRAQATLKQLQGGADFATLAGQVSEDPTTKGNGGQYASALTLNDPQVPPAVTAVLFNLKPGQISGVINAGYTLNIAKLLDRSGSTLHGAHMQFNFQPVTTYTKPFQAKQPPHYYIKLKS
ncbi:MAG TPA: SurA N-terminal domain-containing protein [Candidatus Saccharimonadales bacterium]